MLTTNDEFLQNFGNELKRLRKENNGVRIKIDRTFSGRKKHRTLAEQGFDNTYLPGQTL